MFLQTWCDDPFYLSFVLTNNDNGIICFACCVKGDVGLDKDFVTCIFTTQNLAKNMYAYSYSEKYISYLSFNFLESYRSFMSLSSCFKIYEPLMLILIEAHFGSKEVGLLPNWFQAFPLVYFSLLLTKTFLRHRYKLK